MSSSEVMSTVWEDLKTPGPGLVQGSQINLHAMISSAVEAVLKESINRRTYDNITVVIVAFGSRQDEETTRMRTNESIERHAMTPDQLQPMQTK
jgi:protein phosphatase PTC2/3